MGEVLFLMIMDNWQWQLCIQSVFVFETVLVIFMMLVSGRPLQVMVRPMLHNRFLVCLSVCVSVTLVCCGQTVG